MAFPVILFASDSKVGLPMEGGKFMMDMFKCETIWFVKESDFGDSTWLESGLGSCNYRASFVAPVNGETMNWSGFTVVDDFLGC